MKFSGWRNTRTGLTFLKLILDTTENRLQNGKCESTDSTLRSCCGPTGRRYVVLNHGDHSSCGESCGDSGHLKTREDNIECII